MRGSLAGKLVRAVGMFGGVLRTEGLAPCAECMVRYLGTIAFGMSSKGHPRIHILLYKLSDFSFDLVNRVDTGGVISLPEMEGKGRNYVATPARAWKLIFRHLPIDPPHFTYIDFGCGKGRTLLLACAARFRRVIGVDIASLLLDVAGGNLAKRNARAELLCRDVIEFEFPADPIVLFMYNPFYLDLLLAIIRNLSTSLKISPREVYVVYYSAALQRELAQAWEEAGFSPFRACNAHYPNYAIYHYAPAASC